MIHDIGLIGKKRSGKDTLAAELVKRYGFTRIAFADNVRRFALAVDPLVPDVEPGADWRDENVIPLGEYVRRWGWDQAKENPEVRRLLQQIGTEGGRGIFGEDVWVDAAFRQAGTSQIVFTDVRFPNEANAIKESGGILVRIVRPGTETDDTHSSETALDDYVATMTVHNTGTLEQLLGMAPSVAGAAGATREW